MDHPIAIKRVIATERLVELIFGIAQIDAVNVGRNCAFDHVKRGGRHFFMLRRPSPIQIGMIARAQ